MGVLNESADGVLDGGADMGKRGDEFGGEPGEEADEIVGDEDLAVAVCAGADADGGNFEGSGNLLGDIGLDEFENYGEGACGFDGEGIGEEFGGVGWGLPFYLVSAFFADALGEHADVSHDGNLVSDESGDLRGVGGAAFEFDGIGAGGEKALGIGDGVVWGGVSIDGEIGDDHSVFGSAGDGGGVMDDVIDGDIGGVWKAEHHHAERIADEENIDAGFVEEASGGVIVGGEDGEFFATEFSTGEESRSHKVATVESGRW